ncbi:MAG: hypothetical protein AB7I35_00910 [Ramlibacter sp.]
MMFENQGAHAFMALFVYDDLGNPVWYASSGWFVGTIEAKNFRFTGDLLKYVGGKPAGSPVFTAARSISLGTITVTFTGTGNATLADVKLPGGQIRQLKRFDFGGIEQTSLPNQPELGWYWNPQEPGVGYGVEVQNNQLFMAMFHYATDGEPRWNIVQGTMSGGSLTTATFSKFSNGQTLTGTHKPPVGPTAEGFVSLSSSDPCVWQINVLSTVSLLQKFPFGDIRSNEICRARSTFTGYRLPGTYTGSFTGTENGTMFAAISGLGIINGSSVFSERGVERVATGLVSVEGAFTQRVTDGQRELVYSGAFDTNTCKIIGTWRDSAAAGTDPAVSGGSFALSKYGGC